MLYRSCAAVYNGTHPSVQLDRLRKRLGPIISTVINAVALMMLCIVADNTFEEQSQAVNMMCLSLLACTHTKMPASCVLQALFCPLTLCYLAGADKVVNVNARSETRLAQL